MLRELRSLTKELKMLKARLDVEGEAERTRHSPGPRRRRYSD